MTRVKRGTRALRATSVSPRTAARRARQREEQQRNVRTTARALGAPESLGQARTWDRKKKRYLLVGLCDTCAAQAAWGHAEGFQQVKDPCARCLPLVQALPNGGPSKSKWRKCLTKLEYFTTEQLGEWLDQNSPSSAIPDQCGHRWCERTGYGWPHGTTA